MIPLNCFVQIVFLAILLVLHVPLFFLCFILVCCLGGGGQFRFLGHFYIFFVSFLICVLLGHFSDLSFSSFFPFFLFQPPSKRYKISYTVPAWESLDSFDPLSVKQHSISWVRHDGKSLQPGLQSPQPYNSHLASDWVDSVSRGDVSADVTMLAFPDPASFLAGQLHHHLQEWKNIAASISSPLSRNVLDWLENKVQVQLHFRHLKGNFKGEHFDSASPPQRIFSNPKSCAPLAKFIADTILQRLSTGAISVWGKVGEVDPLHLVMPLTVEPSKPRLCNDNRFLNLWMDDRPFSLDHLHQLSLYVSKDAYQTVCDDKSGYDHILLATSSRKYFGFEWNGWYFTSNTIPFGWKLSAFVYHSTGLLVSYYFRSIRIPCSLYIDDRHSSQIRLPRDSNLVKSLDPDKLNLVSALIASFLVCYTLIKLGYCIGLQKSILQPSQSVPFLGFECDSRLQAFRLLPDRKQKFISLVEAILDSNQVSMTDLQRLAGKCMSMSMEVPGARLFTNEITWLFRVSLALLGHSLCQFLYAVKLSTGFFSSPGQGSFHGDRSDTTNLSCTLMPLPGLAC